MILRCTSAFRGTIDHLTDTQGDFRLGDEIHVEDEIGEFLLRVSPGSFERVEGPAVEGEETASGITAPDRRARGGRRR